jgi:hypothetical protein
VEATNLADCSGCWFIAQRAISPDPDPNAFIVPIYLLVVCLISGNYRPETLVVDFVPKKCGFTHKVVPIVVISSAIKLP